MESPLLNALDVINSIIETIPQDPDHPMRATQIWRGLKMRKKNKEIIARIMVAKENDKRRKQFFRPEDLDAFLSTLPATIRPNQKKSFIPLERTMVYPNNITSCDFAPCRQRDGLIVLSEALSILFQLVSKVGYETSMHITRDPDSPPCVLKAFRTSRIACVNFEQLCGMISWLTGATPEKVRLDFQQNVSLKAKFADETNQITTHVMFQQKSWAKRGLQARERKSPLRKKQRVTVTVLPDTSPVLFSPVSSSTSSSTSSCSAIASSSSDVDSSSSFSGSMSSSVVAPSTSSSVSSSTSIPKATSSPSVNSVQLMVHPAEGPHHNPPVTFLGADGGIIYSQIPSAPPTVPNSLRGMQQLAAIHQIENRQLQVSTGNRFLTQACQHQRERLQEEHIGEFAKREAAHAYALALQKQKRMLEEAAEQKLQQAQLQLRQTMEQQQKDFMDTCMAKVVHEQELRHNKALETVNDLVFTTASHEQELQELRIKLADREERLSAASKEIKKIKATPKPRALRLIDKKLQGKLWRRRFGISATGVCENEGCARSISPIGVRFVAQELHSTKSDLISSANLLMMCSPCGRPHPNIIQHSTSIQSKTVVWLMFGGGLIQACVGCEKPIDFFSSWEDSHIVAVARDGNSLLENRAPMCHECNLICQHESIEEFRAKHSPNTPMRAPIMSSSAAKALRRAAIAK